MVRAKKILVDVKVHCLTVRHTLPLFHVNICIHVNEFLQENLIHQCNVNLLYVTLIAMIDFIQFLSQLKVQLCINNGGSGDHLLFKVQ